MPELGFELGSCGERVVSECVNVRTLWFGNFLLVFVRGRLRFGFADVIERESGRTLTTRRCEMKPEVPEYVWFGCRGVVRGGNIYIESSSRVPGGEGELSKRPYCNTWSGPGEHVLIS